MPLITVIIPTFNVGHVLENALRSLEQQTFQDFEIVIKDNLSSDSTIAVAKKFKNFFKDRLIIVSENDSGIYDGMNKGIDIAKGEWLYFLGADDYLINPDGFKDIFFGKYFNSIDLIYCNANTEDYGLNYDGQFDLEKLGTKNICHQTIFVKKSLFKTVGKFNLQFKALADWDFNLKCFIHPKVRTMHIDILIVFHAGNGFARNNPDINFSSTMLIDSYMRRYRPMKYWINQLGKRFKVLMLNSFF